MNTDEEASILAAEISQVTGEAPDEAVRVALRERLARERRKRSEEPDLIARLEEISRRCCALPILDDRTANEILEYDENGLPS